MTSVGALITKIGFWGLLVEIIVQYTTNPIQIIRGIMKAPILFCANLTSRTPVVQDTQQPATRKARKGGFGV